MGLDRARNAFALLVAYEYEVVGEDLRAAGAACWVEWSGETDSALLRGIMTPDPEAL
jgi:hypothetical protein